MGRASSQEGSAEVANEPGTYTIAAGHALDDAVEPQVLVGK
jgi:hypothetical protein